MKTNKRLWIIGLMMVMVSSQGCVSAVKHREEIGTLMSYSKNQAEQEKVLEKQAEQFEDIKKIMSEEILKVGMSASQVRSKLGDPVVATESDGYVKWSYKPAGESWFKAEVVRIYFNQASKSIEYWQCVRFDCPGEQGS